MFRDTSFRYMGDSQMTAKDREEARKILGNLTITVSANIGPFGKTKTIDFPQTDKVVESTAKIIAHLRAEAKAEALWEAADRAVRRGIDSNIISNAMDAFIIRAAILAVNPSLDEGEARECVWTEDTDGLYETSCGRSWTFIEGGPEANRVHYCHGCGKPVRIADEPKKGE